jgi:hypothetical protein
LIDTAVRAISSPLAIALTNAVTVLEKVGKIRGLSRGTE